MDITSTLDMQTEQSLPDVDMLEEDEGYPQNCEPENSHMRSTASSRWQNSRLHAEDSIFIHMRTLMVIDPPGIAYGLFAMLVVAAPVASDTTDGPARDWPVHIHAHSSIDIGSSINGGGGGGQ
ncbi:hypothetical protein BX070DRAFT_251041 [Coemansia spiralis]|nr:hypothetical protein BX070DRAFT_251041 [Coemansia spiralis]